MKLFAAIVTIGNGYSWSQEIILGIYSSQELSDNRCLVHQVKNPYHPIEWYKTRMISLNEDIDDYGDDY